MHLAFALLLLALPPALFAQRSSNWRVYRASDGMEDSVCTGVSISARSGIWVQHPDRKRVSAMDGYDVQKFVLPGPVASHIYEGRVGQIWSTFAGGVLELKSDIWARYSIADLDNKSDTPILPLRQGQVLVVASNRLISLISEPTLETTTIRDAAATHLGLFTDVIRSRDGGAWIGGQRGIGKFSTLRPLDSSTPFEEHVAGAELNAQNFSALVEDENGGVTCIANSLRDGKKIVAHWDGVRWSTVPNSVANIMRAWRSNDGTFWEVGPNGLVHLHKHGPEWIWEDELLAAQYYDAAVDANGAFWVATSEGLYRHAPLIWQPAGATDVGVAGSSAICAGSQRRLWCLTSSELNVFDGASWSRIALPETLRTSTNATDVLAELANQTLLVGSRSRVFKFDPKQNLFTELHHHSAARLKMLGVVKDGNACFQVGAKNDNSIHLELYDGQQFREFANVPAEVGIGTEAQLAFVAQNGTLWVCADKGVAFYNDGRWQTTSTSADAFEEITAMVDVGQNKIWAAAHDRVLQYNGKDWSPVQAGFDRVNGLLKARDGSVWIASNNGVHRTAKGDWVGNGVEEGLSSLAVRQVVEDGQGHIWAATARGLNLYHPEADNDAPEASIPPIAAESISTEGNVNLEFTARDRWKQTSPDRLLYSYRLDEQDWTPMQPVRTVRFNDLSGGKHFFQVRAMDRNWNVDPKPALLEFFVPVPWFRETRLVLIGGAAGAAVLFFAGIAFNRHRRLVHSYAEVEKIVQQRTRDLEKANRELFQSQKMNALGTLAAGIAHDFNSILSIIKGSAQIIEGNVENPEKIRTRVDRINTAVDQGAGIVKAMLGFSRSSDHQVTQCDLNAVIQDTIQLLGDRFQRDAEVEFEPGENVPAVCVVKDFVQQVVLNFILNAAEAMPGAGRITVRTGKLKQLPSEMVLVPEPAAGYAFVDVQDFGTGITPEIMSRIFEPFFTTKSLSTKRGTGLGLSMAYELAKEMKCGLAVQSKIREGSTFTLIVPIAP
jgi:signal transduction histidine kinase/ligand-binding sensor domain-containing protein